MSDEKPMRGSRRSLPPLRRRLRLPVPSLAGLWLSDLLWVVAAFLAAEWAGRAARADWQGFLAFAAGALIGLPLFLRRPRSPLARALKGAAKAFVAALRRRLRYGFGFDFRPAPGDRAFRSLDALVAALVSVAAGAVLLSPLAPAWLGFARAISGLLFVALLGIFWTLLLATLAGAGIFLFALFQAIEEERALRANPADDGARRRNASGRSVAVVAACAVGALAADLLLGPPAFVLLPAACALLHLALGVVPRRGGGPVVLVRHPVSGALGRLGLFRLDHFALAAFGLWLVLLHVLARGAAAVPAAFALPIAAPRGSLALTATGLLGWAATFVGFLLLAPLTLRTVLLNLRWLRQDPARPRRRTLSHGPGGPGGPVPVPWRFFPTRRAPRRGRADLDYDPTGSRARPGAAPALRRDLAGLSLGERRFILDHFDFVTKRRAFYRGLQRILKAAKGHAFPSGGGFLLSPHHFFLEGLHRDDPGGEEGEARIVGPAFGTVWDPRTRRFLHEMWSALDVDILYFEDAVHWPQLRLVLDRMFERIMQDPDAGPIQEGDFRFLQGVRVFLDLVEPEGPNRVHGGYQEPHFANLSRARILLVFKDRGGVEDEVETPRPRVRVPLGV